jgi:hypothetical protein
MRPPLVRISWPICTDNEVPYVLIMEQTRYRYVPKTRPVESNRARCPRVIIKSVGEDIYHINNKAPFGLFLTIIQY